MIRLAQLIASSAILMTGGAALAQGSGGISIDWEISNRFSPFETQVQRGPEKLFGEYKMNPGESLEDWHRRLSQTGFNSPYKDALFNGRNQEMHWDQSASRHRNGITRFVKQEDNPNTRVRAIARVNSNATCDWTYEGKVTSKPCDEGFHFNLPLRGAELSVELEGKRITELLKPEHVVIVALGDSYASGEGNPDFPGEWLKEQKLPGKNDIAWLLDADRLNSSPETPKAETKHWIDDRCHRSFFSYQSLAALKLASENPHSFVSFLHYACTGAEIFDGLLAPQYQAWGKESFVPYSQVNSAIRDLCQVEADEFEAISQKELGTINIREFHRRGGPGNKPSTQSNLIPNKDNFSRSTAKLRRKNGGNFPQSGFLKCSNDKFRSPDYVFLSIGGNDIGFADIVQYFIVPPQWKVSLVGNLLFPEVCPAPKNRVDRKQNRSLDRYCRKLDRKIGYHAGDLVGNKKGGMANRYALLFNILEHRFGLEPRQIFMPQYPDPLRDAASSRPACSPLSKADFAVKGDTPHVFNKASQWNGLKAAASEKQIKIASSDLIPGRDLRTWQFNLTADDARLALRQFDSFRTVLSKAASDRGINLVCETRDAFVGYGWWKGGFKNLPNTAPEWQVSTWDPYAFEADTRAIRTGNDSVLTQPGDKRITGAVHPNLTGHRLIAEPFVQRVLQDR